MQIFNGKDCEDKDRQIMYGMHDNDNNMRVQNQTQNNSDNNKCAVK